MKSFFMLSVFIMGSFSLRAMAHDHAKMVHDQNQIASSQPSGDSVFNSRSEWRDTSEREVKLNEFSGSKVIIAMAYTSCTYSCPLTISKLKEIETGLIAKGMKDFKIVLASFDPQRDNPANLLKYSKKRKLSSRWVLLSPHSDKDVRELSALLGITYKQDKQGDFSHSNVISYMDEQGVVRKTLVGINADARPFIEGLIGG
jgi:protein SCO1